MSRYTPGNHNRYDPGSLYTDSNRYRPGTKPGDPCDRCTHTRGVHTPHCRIESGCPCEKFT